MKKFNEKKSINLTLPSKKVEVSLYKNDDKKIPYGLSINIADTFILKFAKIIKGKKGLFVGYPSYEIRKGKNKGSYNSFYYIMDTDFTEELLEKIEKQINTKLDDGKDDEELPFT